MEFDGIKTSERRTYVMVQSSARDTNYPGANRYKFNLPRRFVNVKSLNLRSVLIPPTAATTTVITVENSVIQFEVEGWLGLIEIRVPVGDYSLATLGVAINKQLSQINIPELKVEVLINSSSGLVEFRAWRQMGPLVDIFREYKYKPAYATTNNQIGYTVGSDIIATTPTPNGFQVGDVVEIVNSSRNALNGNHVVDSVLSPMMFGLKVPSVNAAGTNHHMVVLETVSSNIGGTVPIIATGAGGRSVFGTWNGASVETWRRGDDGNYIRNAILTLGTTALNVQLSPVGNYLVAAETSGWNAYRLSSSWEKVNDAVIGYPETGPTAVMKLTDNLDYVSYAVGQTYGIYARNGSSWIYRAGVYPTPVGTGITYTRDSNLKLDLNLNNAGQMSLLMYPVRYTNVSVSSASSVKSTWFYNLDYATGATQVGEYQHVVAPGITWVKTSSAAFESPGYINGHSGFDGNTYVVSEYTDLTLGQELSRVVKYGRYSGETAIYTPYPYIVAQSLDTDVGPLFGRVLAVSEGGDFVVMQNAHVDDPYGGVLIIYRGHPVYYFDYSYITAESYRRMNFLTAKFTGVGTMFVYDGNNFQLIDLNLGALTREFGGGNVLLRQPRRITLRSTALQVQLGVSVGVSNFVLTNNVPAVEGITFLRGVNIGSGGSGGGYSLSVLPNATSARLLAGVAAGAEVVLGTTARFTLDSAIDVSGVDLTVAHIEAQVFRPELGISGQLTYFIPTDGLVVGDRFTVDGGSEKTVSAVVGTTSGVGGLYQTSAAIDSISWAILSTPPNLTFNDIAWSSKLGLFVVVAISIIHTSPDGFTWTSRTNPISARWTEVAVRLSDGRFVVVSDLINTTIMYSTTGITWTNVAVSNYYKSICYCSKYDRFVAVGNGVDVMYSDDGGISWNYVSSADATASWGRIIWVKELDLFVAIKSTSGGASTDSIMTSSTGTGGWTMRTSQTGSWFSLAWSSYLNILLVIGASGWMTSVDGINWTFLGTLADLGYSGNTMGYIKWIDEVNIFLLVMNVGGSTTRRVMYSYDGTSWLYDDITVSSTATTQSIAWSPDLNLTMMTNGLLLRLIYSRSFLPRVYRWSGEVAKYGYEGHKVVRTFFRPSATSGITQYYKLKWPLFRDAYNADDRYLTGAGTTRQLGVSYVVYSPADQLTFGVGGGLGVNSFQATLLDVEGGTSVAVPVLDRAQYRLLEVSNLGHSAQVEEGGGIVNNAATNSRTYLARVQLPQTSSVVCKYISGGLIFKAPVRMIESAVFGWYDKDNELVDSMPEHSFVLEVVEYIDSVAERVSEWSGVADRYRTSDVYDIER